MIINGIDVRRYGATLLTAETKPPKMTANYEMMSKALLPTEYDTDIPLGSMTMTIYFRGKNRATLERTMSSFMQNFRSSCIMEEIRGFKGKYKGFLTGDDYVMDSFLTTKRKRYLIRNWKESCMQREAGTHLASLK